MKVLIGGCTGEVAAELSEYCDSVTVIEEQADFYEAVVGEFDLIIVHVGLFGSMYPWEWMSALRGKQPESMITVIPDETRYDSLWLEVLYRLADRHSVKVAPLGSGVRSVLHASGLREHGPASEKATGSNRGIIAAVWSAANKDGATTVAVNTAITLAACSQLTVGLLDLNLKNPEIRYGLQLKDPLKSNLTLRPRLQTGTLSPNDLLDACQTYRKTPRLHILAGTHRRDTAADLTPGMVEHLLVTCRSAFDVTIVDVSSFPDNAATVCAVKHAEEKWLIAQPDFASHRWSWTEWFECYWKYVALEPRDVSLVLNRFTGRGGPPEKIAGVMGMKLAGILPNVPAGVSSKESLEGMLLADRLGAEMFTDGIRRLASRLSVAAGAPDLPEGETGRRNGLLTLLSGLFT